jgi:hypothetical protein
MQNIKDKIKSYVEESLSLIEETKKERFILRRKDLTDDQKQEIIDYLDKHTDGKTEAQFVKSVNGDWNKFNRVPWSEIEKILSTVSKTAKKRKVKSEGINGLEKGKDYIPIDNVEIDPSVSVDLLNRECRYQATGDEEFIGAYMPLDWESSKLIASNAIGNCEGQWCTAYQKDDRFWHDYTGKGGVLIYFIYEETKYAVLVSPSGMTKIWDEYDEPGRGSVSDTLPSIKLDELINKNSRIIDKVSEHHKKNQPIDKLGGFRGIDYNINDDGSVDVYGDVKLSGTHYQLPVRYGKVYGAFFAQNIGLQSLNNFPTEVLGDVWLGGIKNKLSNLYCCCDKIGGSFYCNNIMTLETLQGGPSEVKGAFEAVNCSLTNLIGSPRKCGGDFNCAENPITSIDGSPDKVGGKYYLYDCTGNIKNLIGITQDAGDGYDLGGSNIESLVGMPKFVNGTVLISHNPLKSLKGSPEVIYGGFKFSDTEITDLDGGPVEVKGRYVGRSNKKLKSLVGAPRKAEIFNIGNNAIEDENEAIKYLLDNTNLTEDNIRL